VNAQRIGYMIPEEYIPATYPAGRHCLHRRCITRLSIYNGGDYCAQHEGEHTEPDPPLPFKARIDEAEPGNRICCHGEDCEAPNPEQPLNNDYFRVAISHLADGTTRVKYRRTCRRCEAAAYRARRAGKRKVTA
jgi:hypothetical protein